MPGTYLDIPADDGGCFRGYLALPPAGTGPGLVICQEIFGVNAYLRGVVEGFAAAGYVTVAPDLFWRLEPGVDLGYDGADREKAFSLMQRFDAGQGARDIGAAVRWLRASSAVQGGVGVVGYCLGGKLAFLAAARAGVDVAVGYYGVGIEQCLFEADRIRVPLLLHFAADDTFVPPPMVDRIESAFAGKGDVEVQRYAGVGHGFARPPSMHYHAPSADLANARTLATLQRVLGGAAPARAAAAG